MDSTGKYWKDESGVGHYELTLYEGEKDKRGEFLQKCLGGSVSRKDEWSVLKLEGDVVTKLLEVRNKWSCVDISGEKLDMTKWLDMSRVLRGGYIGGIIFGCGSLEYLFKGNIERPFFRIVLDNEKDKIMLLEIVAKLLWLHSIDRWKIENMAGIEGWKSVLLKYKLPSSIKSLLLYKDTFESSRRLHWFDEVNPGNERWCELLKDLSSSIGYKLEGVIRREERNKFKREVLMGLKDSLRY